MQHLQNNFTSKSLRAFLLGVDQYHEAIRCSTANATTLNLDEDSFFIQSSDNLFPPLLDEPNSIRKRPLSKHIKAVSNNQYDFIICNPPWLPNDLDVQDKDALVSFSDTYVYDEKKDSFISRLFENAAKHLKKDGRLFLVHSDLGYLLGLYPQNFIELLSEQNGLQVKSIYQTKAKVKFTDKDWFHKEKSESKVLLYEIQHPTTAIESVEAKVKFAEQ